MSDTPEKPPLKNYITPDGLQRLRDEHEFLLTRERPAVTKVVAWAASNGDRSENADYQYGKKRLRAIDRRIRFLTKRINAAEVVDPAAPRRGKAAAHVFFGATVRYANALGAEREVSIVGLDEVDLERHHISWVSPLARALIKSGPGDAQLLSKLPSIRDFVKTSAGLCIQKAFLLWGSLNHIGVTYRNSFLGYLGLEKMVYVYINWVLVSKSDFLSASIQIP